MTVDEGVSAPDLMDHGNHASPPLALPVHPGIPRGDRPSSAPDLIGLDARDAHAIARASGLRLAVAVWQTNIGPWGQVLDQQPPPGTQVPRGGSIRIVVSGRPFLPLPDVRGLPLEAAIEQLCMLGFVPIAGSRSATRSMPSGHIIATRPVAGSHVAPGSVVALTIAKADREPPVHTPRSQAEDR